MRADSTRMGVVPRSRSRAMSCTPSMSGRPRSTMASCGGRARASCRPCSAVVAVTGRRPLALRLAATNCAIDASSSTINTQALCIFGSAFGDGQVDAELAAGVAAAHLDLPAVGLDDGLADGQPQARAAVDRGVVAALVTLEQARGIAVAQARAMVAHRDEYAAAAAAG